MLFPTLTERQQTNQKREADNMNSKKTDILIVLF